MPQVNPRAALAVGSVAAGIIAAIFAVEGGYVFHKNDPGGATNHGVTEKVARQHGYTGDMRALPQETAFKIYHDDYIDKPGYKPFLDIEPAVAEELVDGAVNVGTERESRWIQIALNALSQNGTLYPKLVVDGEVGPKTVAAYQALQRARGKVAACQLVLKALDAQQGQHYLNLSLSDPKFQSFTAGWLTHRIGNVPLSKCAA